MIHEIEKGVKACEEWNHRMQKLIKDANSKENASQQKKTVFF